MSVVAFDTNKFIKTLQAAGVSASQAEALSEAVREAVRDSHGSVDVATKRDLKELEIGLRHEMRQMELRMTIKLGTIVIIALGAFTALSKWIH